MMYFKHRNLQRISLCILGLGMLAVGAACVNQATMLDPAVKAETGTSQNSTGVAPANGAQVSPTASASPQPQPTQLNSVQPSTESQLSPKQVALQRKRGEQRFQQIQPGMTYKQAIAVMGPPDAKVGKYGWKTREGKISVEFDANNQAQYYQSEIAVSGERKAQLRSLIRQSASYQQVVAALGGEATTAVAVQGVWTFPGAGKANIFFASNEVSSKTWQPASR